MSRKLSEKEQETIREEDKFKQGCGCGNNCYSQFSVFPNLSELDVCVHHLEYISHHVIFNRR